MNALQRMKAVEDRLTAVLSPEGFRAINPQPLQGRIVTGWERVSAWRRDRLEVSYAKRDPRSFSADVIIEIGPIEGEYVLIDKRPLGEILQRDESRYTLPGGLLSFGLGRFLDHLAEEITAMLPWMDNMYGTQEVTVARLTTEQRKYPEPGSRDYRQALAFLMTRPGIVLESKPTS